MKIFLIIIGIYFLEGCISSPTTSSHFHDTTIVNYTIKQGKPLPTKEWHCYIAGNDKFCAPEAWGYVKQDSFLFMSDLSKISAGSYFLVLKEDMSITHVNATKYLKKLYLEMKKDNSGVLTGWKAFKIIYSDKEIFHSEYNISINKIPYKAYSTVFEFDNNLYDIFLKMEEDDIKPYQEAYNNIIFNFFHKNKLILTSRDKIIGAKILDLDKL